MIKKLLATSSMGLLLAACGGHDASIELLPVSASTTVQGSVQTQAVQMVIVADHTSSMKSVNAQLIKNIPSFVNNISTNDVEVFCTHAFNIKVNDKLQELQESFKTKGLSKSALVAKIKNCLDFETNKDVVGDKGNTDERGLESAVNAWKKIKEDGKLNLDAIKVTLLASNEDDCSRKDGEACGNLNITQIESGLKGYLNNSALISPATIATELNGFSKDNNHIFAPIVITDDSKTGDTCTVRAVEAVRAACTEAGTCTRSEAVANGLNPKFVEDDSYTAEEQEAIYNANALRIFSVGERPQKVAELLGQTPYCIMDNFSDVFSGITEEIIKIEGEPVIVLGREPKNIDDIKVTVTRKITDKVTASNVNLLRLSDEYQWKQGKEEGTMVRVLSPDEISYDADTKSISFKGAYTPGLNDSLGTNSITPAKFDRQLNN